VDTYIESLHHIKESGALNTGMWNQEKLIRDRLYIGKMVWAEESTEMVAQEVSRWVPAGVRHRKNPVAKQGRGDYLALLKYLWGGKTSKNGKEKRGRGGS